MALVERLSLDIVPPLLANGAWRDSPIRPCRRLCIAFECRSAIKASLHRSESDLVLVEESNLLERHRATTVNEELLWNAGIQDQAPQSALIPNLRLVGEHDGDILYSTPC